MKSIVAAFDLSAMAKRVVQRAMMLADTHEAALTLVHVGEVPDMALPDDMLDRLRLYRHSRAEEILTNLKSKSACNIDIKVLRGSVAVEVAKLAKHADLLLTGTSSLDAQRIGPRTTRLARKVSSSVLAVRRQPRVKYRKVVAAVDLSDPSRHAVDLALAIAPDAEITLAASLPVNAELLLAEAGVQADRLDQLRTNRVKVLEEQLEKYAVDWGDRVKTAVTEGPVAFSIAEVARRRGADLVTVASRGAGGSSMVLLGSVAESVMEAVPCDVAVARVPGPFRRP